MSKCPNRITAIQWAIK